MSSQDFMQLHNKAAEGPGVDIEKMLEWIIALKLLEATAGGGE
jgi:hypothetical protein